MNDTKEKFNSLDCKNVCPIHQQELVCCSPHFQKDSAVADFSVISILTMVSYVLLYMYSTGYRPASVVL